VGYPLRDMGVLESSRNPNERPHVMADKVCLECGNATVIHKDGCDFLHRVRGRGAVRVNCA
jgi:ribonucleoside-diphosphate reductase alpha chain